MTGSNVQFLIMIKSKEKTVPNLCTDFGSRRTFLALCAPNKNLFIFNMVVEKELGQDSLIHEFSVEITSFTLIFVATNEKVE